jgi:hypothetical protein
VAAEPNPIPPELRLPGQVELPIGGRRRLPVFADPEDEIGPAPVAGMPGGTGLQNIEAATELDTAFAALPTATADEQRAGSVPVFGRPATASAASRFAPDLTKVTPDPSVYAIARPPQPGTEGQTPQPTVRGTVVTTISTGTPKKTASAAAPTRTPRPPISHIVAPPPAAADIDPDGVPPLPEIEAPAAATPTPEPVLVPVPVPSRPAGRQSVIDDETVPPARLRALRERQPVAPLRTPAPAPTTVSAPAPATPPTVGSLLGEIGGLPRVEVRTTRPVPITDPVTGPKDRARESYELRSRELERVAQDRLMREQQRLELTIREQLAHDKRELESVLDNRLEDTVLRPPVLDNPPPLDNPLDRPLEDLEDTGTFPRPAFDDSLDGPAD